MSENLPLVLFLDDIPDIREMLELKQKARDLPFEPVFAGSQDEALAIVHNMPIVAAILDVNLMGESGASVAEQLHLHYPHIRKVFLTAYDRAMVHESAEEFEMDVIVKPITMQDLIKCVMSLIRDGKVNCDAAREAHRLARRTGPLTMPSALRKITSSIFLM
jgi:DNA-binding NtrC family response regulator